MPCRVNPIKVVLNFVEYNAKLATESTKRDVETLRDITGKVAGGFGEKVQRTFAPEKAGEEAQAAATSVIQRRAQAGAFNNQFANEIYRQLQFQDEFKNGDKAFRRDGYVNKYSKAVQTEMLMKSEEGKPTGDPIYDRMADVNRYIYHKLTTLDEQEGITYETRANYMKHVIDPASEKEFEAYVAKNMKFANPSYMKAREFDTYRQAMAARDSNGKPLFKLRTTSPERLLQIRISEFAAARAKIQVLGDLARRGLAWETTGPNTPEQIKKAWENYRIHTADGKNYFVHPDAFQLLGNAFNPSSIAGTVGGSMVEFLKTMKGLATPLRLGLSIAHEDHLSRIRLADRWTNILLRPGLPQAGDFIIALSDTAAQAVGLGGYPGMVRDSIKYGGIIHVLRGDRGARNADEAWAVKQLVDAGFRANVSAEREMEFTQWLDERMPKLHDGLRQFGRTGEFAFQLASLQSLQRYMFSQVIPSVKAASLLEKISNIYKEHPELERPENNDKRLVAVQKAGKQVDLRFGEMNWDNVFWPKAWKDVAIGSLLSASWQMGLIDYSVGSVKDLTKSALHMDQTVAALRDKGPGTALRKAVTDRAMTSFFYTLTTMARGAVISYAFTGGVHSFMDYFFPKVGTNPDGTDKRLRVLDFAPEMMAWWNHSHEQTGEFDPITGSLTMARNKLSPVLSSAAESLTNTSYFGSHVSDSGLFTQQGFYDRMANFVENTFTPFTGGAFAKVGEQAIHGKPLTGAPDALMAFFGMNEAPHWTQRSATENAIIREYGTQYGHSSAKASGDLFGAMHAYQEAVAANDSEGILEAYKELKKLGVEDKKIANAAKDYKTPVAQKLFKGLNVANQEKVWATMTAQERVKYFPLLHKASKAFLSTPEAQKSTDAPLTFSWDKVTK
jgi:hypothetical protein